MLYESVMGAIIRFWDNRFILHRDNEINYLKLEIEKERLEKRKLMDFILELNKPIDKIPDTPLEDYKPLNQNIPWRSRKMQLEQNDRKEFDKLKRDAEIRLEEAKSTEELEAELLGAS